jgi:hypothetical protein
MRLFHSLSALARAARWRVLLGLSVALIPAATLTVGAASAQPPSPTPGYLADDYSALELGSNQFISGAKLVGPSRPETDLFPKAHPDSDGPIWTFKCTNSAETVKFSRSVWLPGPPNYGGSFTYGSVLGQREAGALTSINLTVNGDVIVSERMPYQTAYFRVAVSGTAVNAFHYGNNTISVSVHKRKTHGACNTRNPATQLGVLFRVKGQFETDLAVNPPEPIEYHKLAPGQTYTQGIYANFRNQGPSWEPNGMLQVNVTGAQSAVLGSGVGTAAPGPPLTSCQVSDNGLSHIFQCGLSDFAPFTAGSLGTVFAATAPAGSYTDFTVIYQVYISAGTVTDLNSGNNSTYHEWVFCGPQSTKPGCQTAS